MSRNTGLTTKNKLVLLAGAAALVYYYKRSKAAAEKKYNQPITYYRSKNGGIYYRDPTDKSRQPRAIFVTPPSANYTQRLSPAEAAPYADAQGYNGQQTGNNLDYYFKPA